MKRNFFIAFFLMSMLAFQQLTYAAKYKQYNYEWCDGGPNGYDYVDGWHQSTYTDASYNRIERHVIICRNPGAIGCTYNGMLTGVNLDDQVVMQNVNSLIANGQEVGHINYDGSIGNETINTFNPTAETTPCFLWEASEGPQGTCVKMVIFDEVIEE